jgi:hypothetical protein
MASESVTIDCMNRKKNTEMIVGVVCGAQRAI